MQYVYGPIPSRRLGQSLGVDPIPLKTCNWNCVYCQLGRTSSLVNERREWAPRQAIVDEVAAVLAAHAPGTIDHVSFVGSGEPTLHIGLGWMIQRVQALSSVPVAVITNGALLCDATVRSELLAADVVMPTLSAGSEALYRRMHRPHPDLHLADMVEGLVEFRRAYQGKLWIEVMLLRDVNDDDAALQALAALLARAAPDQVHLTLPDRPPTEPWIEPPDADGLMRATAILGSILGDAAQVVPPSGVRFDFAEGSDPEAELLAIFTRHPMSEAQVTQALAGDESTIAALEALARSGKARLTTRLGVRFWTTAEQRFEPASVVQQQNGAQLQQS